MLLQRKGRQQGPHVSGEVTAYRQKLTMKTLHRTHSLSHQWPTDVPQAPHTPHLGMDKACSPTNPGGVSHYVIQVLICPHTLV